jgi:transposase
VIDSQWVKADAVVGADSRGFDGGKLLNGRKRHVVVDTLGLLLGVMVTGADTGDRTAAKVLLEQVADAHHRLALVWADGGYTGSLVEYCLAGTTSIPKPWPSPGSSAALDGAGNSVSPRWTRLGPRQCASDQCGKGILQGGAQVQARKTGCTAHRDQRPCNVGRCRHQEQANGNALP